MALDRMLREGLDRATGNLDPATDRLLAATLRQGRRGLRARRVAVVASTVVLVGVVAIVGSGALERSMSTERPGGNAPPLALVGVWQTGVVSRADEATALRRIGYDDDALRSFMRELGSLRTNIFSISFDGTRFVTSVQTDEGGAASIDSGTYTIDGNLLRLTYPSRGRTTFFAQIVRGRLSLAVVTDSQPDYRGRPAEIFVTAVYTVASFVAQP